jgi:folate-binding protein YgfZ
MDSSIELQSLRERAVLVDGAGHDIIRATGNDRVVFLHRITSGKVAGLEVGQGGQTLLLDVRGRVLARLLVFVRGKSVRIIVPAGQGESIVAGLAKFAIMDDFAIALESELASLAVLGPGASAALSSAGVAVPAGVAEAALYSHAEIASDRYGALWVAHGRSCGVDGLCVVATRSARAALVDALDGAGVPRLSGELAEGLRIAALEPKLGNEITPDRFPVEVGLGAAIDHGKGCYVGQETIVRMRDRGNVRKRLVLLRLQGEAAPKVGDKLAAEGQPTAGVVTSVGSLPGDGVLALAVTAAAVPVGAKVEVQGEAGKVVGEVAAETPPWG